MGDIFSIERDAASFIPRKMLGPRPSPVNDTAYLSFDFDMEHRALWTFITAAAPPFVSTELLADLLCSDRVCCAALATEPSLQRLIDFRVLASCHNGIFSLGGDLALFRYQIERGDREGLSAYARSAVDAIWANISASGDKNLTTVSLVQGEAQGGGFEAALSSHILAAERGVRFGFPEALFGMFPGMGGYALLNARADAETARRLLGSTNRYPAEMLYEMGIVDVLLDKGDGVASLREWMDDVSEADRTNFRSRFGAIEYEDLLGTVNEWVDQALSLNARQIRTMGYILEAQKLASRGSPKTPISVLHPSVDRSVSLI